MAVSGSCPSSELKSDPGALGTETFRREVAKLLCLENAAVNWSWF